jgi:putative redox protein
MEVTAEYLTGSKFQVEARGHRVICDQPVDNGGADQGMTPPEFLLASLATCAAYYAAQYLQAHDLPTDHLHVKVTAQKARQPARLGLFRIEVTGPAVDNEQQAGLVRAVKACLIHNTLLVKPEIEIALNAPMPALIAA